MQRRYGVRLGIRYILPVAGVFLMGVLGCSQINSSAIALADESPLPTSESPISQQTLNPVAKTVTTQ